ncbi:MAG: 4Fe-4S dicluster domain-containing protein [Candidatus Eisenbacteria bacterium]|nr:4Fe-4S dicluster domain-containing protein [Candidatus Eisenbacteria bacterium]
MKKPKLRELKEALTAVVKGPDTTSFPITPLEPAEAFRGQPLYDEDYCIGCGACAEVCPARTIDVIDEGNTRTLIHHFDNCIYCGQCEANCTTKKGIRLSHEYALAVFDRAQAITSVEKELVRCERCGEVITTREHLEWIARKVGSLAVANPTLLVPLHQRFGATTDPGERPDEKKVGRYDSYMVMCPACRREVYLTEDWEG